jgi:demethylmenaquinone methyltransferase/2-methoxy-6-polyprenyl-1,4-benzoquinol methylase
MVTISPRSLMDPKPASSNRPLPILTAYYDSEAERRGFVRRLFDTTAGDYDRVERLLSFGTGARYRRQALLRGGLKPGMRVLDVAIGTGLVAREALAVLAAHGCVVGLDPSAGMLREARAGGVTALVQGVGERLPFAEGQFDFISIGYALRHVSDLGSVFREFRRVLRPGGIACVLEIARPDNALSRGALKLYLRGIAPVLSRIVGRTPEAPALYRYFWDTIEACVPPVQIIDALREAGFEDVGRHVEARMFSEYTARR